MTLQSAISAGFSAVATADRAIRTLITGSNTGNISGLTTINKSSIVASSNEIKARSSVGFRFTYNMAAQPRDTWVQATGLTSIFNTATAQLSQASGTFTMSANTIANVVGNWIFGIDAEAGASSNIPVAVEIRIGGTQIARIVIGGAGTTIGINTRVHMQTMYPIAGGEAITFWFMHDYQPLLGIGGTTSVVTGSIYGAPI